MKPQYLLYSLLILGFCSCVKPLEIDMPEHEPRLVINCQFSDDQPWKMIITHTRAPLSTVPFSGIDNALVEISDKHGPIDTLVYIQPSESYPLGHYYSPRYPEVGVTYTLRVSAQDYPTATATSLIPEATAQIEAADFATTASELLQVSFQDLSVNSDFYQVTTRTRFYRRAGDEDSTLTLHAEQFNPYTLRSNLPPYTLNIDDGIPARERDGSTNGFMFSDTDFNASIKEMTLHLLSIDPPKDLESNQSVMGHIIEIRTLHPDYFLYKKSLADQNGATSALFAASVNLHTNIENGYGNFSGYSIVNSQILWKEE